MKKIKIFAPGTIANISCGFDILGMAIEKPLDEIIISKIKKPIISIKKIHGAKLPYDVDKNVCGVVLKKLLSNYIKLKNIGFEIEIFKNINPGSGIGSSAASSAGVIVGANLLLNKILNKYQMIELSMEGEKISSGNYHADNVAPAIIGGITLIRSYKPIDIIKINTPKDLWISLINPKIKIKTSDARKILNKKILLKNAVKQWGNIGGLISGLEQNDYKLIGRSMEDFIIEPIRSVLIPNYYELKIECKKAGALGGGISGSGPSIFMLSKGQKKALLVSKLMDKIYSKTKIKYEIFTSKINKKGIKWEKME